MAEEMDSQQNPVEPSGAAGDGENGAACGEGCACHATGAGGKMKLVIGQIVVVIEKTAEKIRARGTKLGIFTFEDGSPEYADIVKQVPPPGVLAMVKGRGASAVSGDITESKLMQAFVAASSGGGCGPASSGCCP